MLNGYRVLDLTDEKGFICGKILGDLGADVIKIERPGGDPSRRIGPFYQNTPDPEKSLNWFAFNSSKKGITLNLEDAEGQDLFKKLAEKADFIIESFPVGYLDKLGLGYKDLKKQNKGLIMTSITPFGQTGPYKDYKASDITISAMSGLISIIGEPERPPIRMCYDQSYYLASAEAAVGALMALSFRHLSGEGQAVDVSIYECAVRTNYREPFRWEFEKQTTQRMGNIFARGGVGRKQFWPCKDGFVTWMLLPQNANPVRGFVEMMKEEGQAGKWGDLNWDEVKLTKWSEEEIKELEKAISDFMLTKTTKELENGSLNRKLQLSPVNSIDFMVEDENLAYRNFWKEMDHPELNTTLKYPRFSYVTSANGNEIRSRAPLIGEHNQDIFRKELGLTVDDISSLKERSII